ncbi:MAG: hypothetical protein ACRDSL_27000, partial [Pseudonocardiaceae bacterium]
AVSELVEGAEAMIRQYWPLHGPYSPGHTAAATSTIADLVRYLNYATGQGGHQALPHAADVYTVLGGLSAAAGGLEQTLRQLGDRTDALSQDPTLGHSRRRDDRAGAQAQARAAGQELSAATHALVALHDALTAAQSHLTWLYHREEPDDA